MYEVSVIRVGWTDKLDSINSRCAMMDTLHTMSPTVATTYFTGFVINDEDLMVLKLKHPYYLDYCTIREI